LESSSAKNNPVLIDTFSEALINLSGAKKIFIDISPSFFSSAVVLAEVQRRNVISSDIDCSGHANYSINPQQ